MKMQSSGISLKIVVEQNGMMASESYLSFESAGVLTSYLEDSESNREVFELLSDHPASEVRSSVAQKDNLTEKCLGILSKDGSINVRRNLSRSSAFKRWANDQVLLEFIRCDPECAVNIASSIEDFLTADQTIIGKALCDHTDPSVRYSLAGNYNAPKKLLKQLSSDQDPKVSGEAKRRLA